MRSVAKSGKSENGQIAVNSADVNSISMRLPTYSYSKVSSGWRFISSTGVERISSCVSGVTSRSGGNLLLAAAPGALIILDLIFFEANIFIPLQPTPLRKDFRQMPRACPVEVHARRYSSKSLSLGRR